MSARAPRRLPGFRFETQAPPLPEVLPRMDVAVFVGFAASGPLQTPVAVESEPQFTAIFGDDAPGLGTEIFAARTASMMMPAEFGESQTSSLYSRLSGTSPKARPSRRT